MNIKSYILILFGLCYQLAISQNTQDQKSLVLQTTDTVFVAGTFVSLNFTNSENFTPSLYLTNSFGTTIIDPTRVQKYLFYTIPTNIANKRGRVNWSLIHNKKVIQQGKVDIISDDIVSKIETYVGPPSVQAGGIDFAMSVMIPIDTLDNPVMDNSKVTFKKQFLAKEDTVQLVVKDLLSYETIYSPLKTGRFLISSKCNNKQSTEHTLNVWASLPSNFTITAESNHNYADGNQICTLKTSVIKDAFGNLVTDGTAVSIIIEDKNGDILSANCNTINGVGQTKFVHPDHEQQWKIKAFVYGMAESTPITLSFQQVITDFDVVFSENNREITVGPLRSFMEQMIPDGLRVELEIGEEGATHKYMISTSNDGYVKFILDPENYKNQIYNFKITTAEISKIFKNKSVW
ncbi:hypothetical protein [Flavicella sediminum]|uniref:hypothetical protein n=1 Tax=Flavicella sediminum TaxID=2585141 RepID=UPI00111CB4DB|nr:hypothetical protein [Flavicella sediminum]